MKQSQLFTKTRKEAPADEVAKNAQLLIRAGFINKEMAGVYSYLPLGLRVLGNLETIIREEMNAIGGQELLLTTLQDKESWEKSDRWDESKVDVWFKTKLASGTDIGLGWTHEEAITAMMRQYIQSYRDLPVYAYQIQTKFRNEARAKSGLMRGREFIMKDLYSFSRTQEDLDAFYEACAKAYERIFARAGIGEITYRTFASGGAFSKYSHEFQAISAAGEDVVYVDKEKRIAINKEVLTDEVIAELGLNKDTLVEEKSIEVGNIFKLGTRFSDPLGLSYVNETGETKPVIMGSYGIGPGRLMGTIVEALSDAKGIIWPREVSPFEVHIVSLGIDNEEIRKASDSLYEMLTSAGIDTLYDDRTEKSAGEKLADADLIGIPVRLVVSARTLESASVEMKKRAEADAVLVRAADVIVAIKTA
ncbi:MAG: prolyl-tRNA synthetase [Candidatus Ryanbacteria bacterium RIFCSPHIGHO2_02_FULL_48_12]|uniref:Proline--tRNA ligase n=1 Tax=Candidatus Ryanbacteria bacterium RIFCSPHIGHO2_01_FULL_48_27 TaxID=1802115 RepID=A0A1G2G6R8_9BACT|nr:MAG: prolyl-tRNA synthetase [Candidatus Ryanbacteria bacterium RIFCSPHIGHO2_01_FULL_48_27]OGZ50170.1 MAG: prolyl-tRNA synthetase [Candidatus Ryanbacteria bacterium RIFCSPHIGHO2_02_FULL_48_12]